MRDTRISNFLPASVKEHTPLKIYYSYDLPSGRKIFNYNKFLKELDREIMNNILGTECKCENSPFLYEPHGHILTGDLSLVSNDSLRHIMSFGTKFREPVYQDADELYNNLVTALDDFLICGEVHYF